MTKPLMPVIMRDSFTQINRGGRKWRRGGKFEEAIIDWSTNEELIGPFVIDEKMDVMKFKIISIVSTKF